MHKLLLVFITLLSCLVSFSQNLSYSGKHSETGEPGVMITPQLEITNTGTTSVDVFVNRFYLNLPANWTSCFCYIECNPPEQNTLSFTLVPGETAYIGVGFNTDMTPGIGTVKLTVEEVGTTGTKDTLLFTAETLVNGIKKNVLSAKAVLYPNPTGGKVFMAVEKGLSFNLYNESGQLLKQTTSNEFDLESLPKGIYYIKTVSKSGSDTQKIIKN